MSGLYKLYCLDFQGGVRILLIVLLRLHSYNLNIFSPLVQLIFKF